VQVGLAAGKPLGQGKRIPGFHQDMEAPTLDLRVLAAVRLDDFGRLCHGFAFVRRVLDEPCPGLLVANRRPKCRLRPGHRLFDPLRQLAQPGLEDGSLRLGVGGKRVEAPPQLLFGLDQP